MPQALTIDDEIEIEIAVEMFLFKRRIRFLSERWLYENPKAELKDIDKYLSDNALKYLFSRLGWAFSGHGDMTEDKIILKNKMMNFIKSELRPFMDNIVYIRKGETKP